MEEGIKIIYIKTGYTDAQKKASKKYYEKNKDKYLIKAKKNYQDNIEENRRKARERYYNYKTIRKLTYTNNDQENVNQEKEV
jgi:CRISPR/Cas system-associated protein Cas5 (RAMP superfamily)